ncbi:hypothetical protein FPV67DRAFT_1448052 [Lyophyllum atratum]|nr:hypothetical protein FPV67DRAFT_1448052 [Lyophyllum atratum]
MIRPSINSNQHPLSLFSMDITLDNPATSSSLEITLDTPPSSPPLLSLDDPTGHCDSQKRLLEDMGLLIPNHASPQKRQRTRFYVQNDQLKQARVKKPRHGNSDQQDSVLSTTAQSPLRFWTDDMHMASDPQEFDSGLQNDVPSSNAGYLAFVEAIFCNVTGFFCLKRDIFVVQRWNSSQGRATKEWYHLQLDRSSPILEPVCLCPTAKLVGECVHQDFFNEFEVENPATYEGQKDDVILFCRDLRETDSVNLFSVASAKNPHLVKSRKIVAYTGDDRGTGCWTCTADSGNSCAHIYRAKNTFQQLLKVGFRGLVAPTEKDRNLTGPQPQTTGLAVAVAADFQSRRLQSLGIRQPSTTG